MVLAAGARLGPYEIVSRIGKGGMGEVWKARDPRVDREVAIKISAQQFSGRFGIEARAIAALNHSNICTLFDVGPDYLVMELIDGPTLAERIAQGPIPLEEALAIARQIADALDAAHEKGIVHRDLKPGNVKIRPDGSVKVLDFGLAKAGGGAQAAVTSDSPTLVQSPTQAGVILGTAAYMAPEQARGKTVDKRADIWSFGVVLYEMLTGKLLFAGEDLTDTLASVVKVEPDLSLAPAKVRRLIESCLQKDPRKRLRDVGDAWRLLDEGETVPSSRSRLGAGIALLAVALVAATGAAVWRLKPAPPAAHVVTRFRYPLPEGQTFSRTGRHVLAISSDGAELAYVANQQLYLRAMDQLEAQPVGGTNEDPMEPVFSPDGRWLAYFAGAGGEESNAGPRVLKKIAVAGGAPIALSQLPGRPYGATWRDGTIAFGIDTASVAGIQAVADSGGAVRTLVTGDRKKERLMQPRLLADGKHVLFVSVPLGATQDNEGQIVVQALSGKERKILVSGGSDPRVLPPGQLVYIHNGKLLAVPIDTHRLVVNGGPIALVEGVAETSTTWAGQFAFSQDGTLAFSPGAAGAAAQRLLVWVDRQGHEEPIPAPPRAYRYPRLSPDGTKIAVDSVDEGNDIWVYDLAKKTLTRLTFGPGFESHPVWTPDGKLLFGSGHTVQADTSRADIFRKAADGSGAAEALTQRLEGGYPLSVSPDGKSLVFMTPLANLSVLPLEPKGEAHSLIAAPRFGEWDAAISPNGRWIAYYSDESARREVYVRPFPAVDSGKWQISSERGTDPMWARSGRELFFVSADKRMVAVPVPAGAASAQGSFTYGKPQPLFDASPYFLAPLSRPFDISADGRRFLMLKDAVSGETPARPSIVVVSHWFDEVKARVSAQR